MRDAATGASAAVGAAGAHASPVDTDVSAALRAMDQWGTTGVLDVISACVSLRSPTLVYPVSR